MKKSPRLLLLLPVTLVSVSWFSAKVPLKKAASTASSRSKKSASGDISMEDKLQDKASEAKLFVKQKGFNNNIAFLIDMSLPSGQNRFFIYDLVNDSLISAAPVAHGGGYSYSAEGLQFSNVVGSGLTSLGRYRIGKSYTGMFGYSYKLHGLDSSNNNAFERTVVLHGHSCVPETAVPNEICQSLGCPTVAPGFLEKLKKIINTSPRPVMLWIYT